MEFKGEDGKTLAKDETLQVERTSDSPPKSLPGAPRAALALAMPLRHSHSFRFYTPILQGGTTSPIILAITDKLWLSC